MLLFLTITFHSVPIPWEFYLLSSQLHLNGLLRSSPISPFQEVSPSLSLNLSPSSKILLHWSYNHLSFPFSRKAQELFDRLVSWSIDSFVGHGLGIATFKMTKWPQVITFIPYNFLLEYLEDQVYIFPRILFHHHPLQAKFLRDIIRPSNGGNIIAVHISLVLLADKPSDYNRKVIMQISSTKLRWVNLLLISC